jgi:RNA polymerase sigma factor (sigma-70 family)
MVTASDKIIRSRVPSTQPSAADLVAGCRAGDKHSWERLIARYETLVYTVARRNGLGPEDASDVTQIVFSTLLSEIHTIRNVERLPSWLATVARRQAWRILRRDDRTVHTEVELVALDDPYVDWERFEAVNEAMSRLGEPCRELLLMLFFDPAEPTHAEVATRLGRALGGIGPLRGRCLDKLRSIIEAGES